MQRWRNIGFIVLCLAGVANSAAGQDAKSLAKQMEGTWAPVSAELSGQPFPEAVLKTMRLTMQAGKYTTLVGETKDEGAYTIDAKPVPNRIDIVGAEGPNKGMKLLAIFEFDGDKLRICYDLTGKQRPSEFKTDKSQQHFLVVYERQAK